MTNTPDPIPLGSEPETGPTPDRSPPPSDSASASTDEHNVIELLQRLKSGRMAPASLHRDHRRMIVEHVHAEGMTIPEIAMLLEVSDRTISRDLDHIRTNNALRPDPDLAPRLAGEVAAETRNSIARIRRVTREKDCPHAVRIDGERAIADIYAKHIGNLQQLGVLPMPSMFSRTLIHTEGNEFDGIQSHVIECQRVLAVAEMLPGISPAQPEPPVGEPPPAESTEPDAPEVAP